MSKEKYSLRADESTIPKLTKHRPIITKHLRVYFVKTSSTSSKIAIRIPKKYVKLAVVRNFIRRRLLNQFRESLPSNGIDVLLTISNKIHSAKNEISDILMQEWKLCIQQLRKL